ncbi:hypothetical protein R1flu_016149 [Riccia fluitans]|uniref:Uncharacterized protein n=1 Tax=Riccia fluitans TaxID=41844 RepID=A0ABD1YLI4_9MARC
MAGAEGNGSWQEPSTPKVDLGASGSKGRILKDTGAKKILEAFTLFLQQQQSTERKEMLAIKALHAVVEKLDQFDGRDISKYLRTYKKKMELNRVLEKEMIQTFELALIPEIREHVKGLIEHFNEDWEVFSRAMKEEYFLEDSDRVTKRSFLEWVERPNKNLLATELLREFERQFSQLTRIERMTLQSDKTMLFLRSADPELQEKLELLLEDKEADEGLTTNWKDVEDAVGLIAKRKRRREKITIRRFAPKPMPTHVLAAPMSIVQPGVPVAQVRPTTQKKDEIALEEIM